MIPNENDFEAIGIQQPVIVCKLYVMASKRVSFESEQFDRIFDKQ